MLDAAGATRGPTIVEEKIFQANGTTPFPVTLIFARGATVWGAMTKEMHDRIAKRAHRGIRLIDLPNPLGHIEVDPPSFIDSVKILCGDSSCGDLEH